MVTGASASPLAMPRTISGLFVFRLPGNLVTQNLPHSPVMAHDDVFGKQALDGTLRAMCRLLGLAKGKRGRNLVGKARLEGLA